MAKESIFLWLTILSINLTITYASQLSKGNNVSFHYLEGGQTENKLPYFDLTDIIDQGDWEQVEKAMKRTSRVYYSTDLLITDILELSDIAVQINQFATSHDTTKTSPCLVVAFQMTVNRSDIDWRHIEDVLYLSPQPENSDNHTKRLNVMKTHLCAIVLDFQLGGLGRDEFTNYRDPFRYSHEWNLSFTKYAKKILKSLFGNDVRIPVGVIINEHQVRSGNSSEVLLRQEIRFADFLMVNLEFSPLTRMPLDYSTFDNEFRIIRSETERFLNRNAAINGSVYSNGNVTRHLLSKGAGNVHTKNVTYMASWMEQSPSEYKNLNAWAYDIVLNSSQVEYFDVFQEHISRHIGNWDYRLGVVTGSFLTFIRNPRPYRDVFLPYLHKHEVDTTSCELGRILSRIYYVDSVVVNEFTWNALVHNEEKLKNITSLDCARIHRLETPNKALFFATRGIGAHWDTTQKMLEILLREHSSVAGMNLTTIVFSAEDAKKSAKSDHNRYATPGYSNPVGIAKFTESLLEGNESEVGCLVDFVNLEFQSPWYLAQDLRDECVYVSPTSLPSVMVIQYNMNLTSVNFKDDSSSFRQSKENLQRDLLKILIAREYVKDSNPGIKRIMLNVEFQRNNVVIRGGNGMIMAYKQMFHIWAHVHEFQVVFPMDTREA